LSTIQALSANTLGLAAHELYGHGSGTLFTPNDIDAGFTN
jgi:hypothetical protein